MKFGNSVADIFIIKHAIWLGCVQIWHFYLTLSRGTVFSWTQCNVTVMFNVRAVLKMFTCLWCQVYWYQMILQDPAVDSEYFQFVVKTHLFTGHRALANNCCFTLSHSTNQHLVTCYAMSVTTDVAFFCSCWAVIRGVQEGLFLFPFLPFP